VGGLVNIEFKKIKLDLPNRELFFTGTWLDSFEVLKWRSHYSDPSMQPVCHILSGMISGYASAVLGSEVLVKELTCRAKGDKHCSFEGRPVDKWDIDPNEVREYFPIKELDQDLNHMRASIKQSFEDSVRQSAEIKQIKRQTPKPESNHGIIFRSEPMAQLLFLAEKVSPTNATVLIQGESGTGKEIIARFIHRHSNRESRPFLAISCAALPPNLLESELFGHVKGAFTGADTAKKGLMIEAGEGTFLLDEVGELSPDLQAKLLRALQEKEVRPVGGVKNIRIKTRIIASTNRDLKKMVDEGTFREDLYYRLAVFPLSVTPLRQRREDILLLARHFLDSLHSNHPGFSPEAVRLMETHLWPGNVRELENCVEYATVLAGNNRIMSEHLPLSMVQASKDPISSLAMDLPTHKELETRYTKLVLEHTGNNKTEASKILGVSVTTLWRRLKE
jgi:transcriptional regulator with PAS, ATPase and Fis domain